MTTTGETPITQGTEFTTEYVTFGTPKVNTSGGKNVGVFNSQTKKGTYLATPLMLTWGINEWVDDKTGRRTYDMSLQFPNEEYMTAETTQFLENMKAFEAYVLKTAITNSREWFNKPKMSADVADALWTPMLRYRKNKETQEVDYTSHPTLRVKIPYWDDNFNAELYDMDGNMIFPDPNGGDASFVDYIPKASNVALVIQCGGIWFANGKFGVTWKLVQAVVKPRASLKGKCHIKLSTSDKERLENQTTAEDDTTDVPVTTTVSDSEEEASDEEDHTAAAKAAVVEEVKPKVVKRKKVVRRVKKAPAATDQV